MVNCTDAASAPLLLCPSALKFFYRRVEIHFLILSILLILSKRETLGLSVKIILSQSSIDAKTQSLPHAVSHLLPSSQCLCASRLSLRSACSLSYGSRTPTRGGYVPLCLKQRGPSAVFRFIQTFEHSNIQTFSQLELPGVVRAGRSK